jgi:hypothetical protein
MSEKRRDYQSGTRLPHSIGSAIFVIHSKNEIANSTAWNVSIAREIGVSFDTVAL